MGSALKHFHRVQIIKAQSFIRDHLDTELTLDAIAEFAGSSRYHFIRLFSAYIGETPFEYIQRQKILKALRLLQNKSLTVTDISYDVGFESQSSFNKAFKKLTFLNPSDFRNLGKDQQDKVQYDLNTNEKQKEIFMNLNLSKKPEVIQRAKTTIFTLEEQGGPFHVIATVAWQKFLQIISQAEQDVSQSEFLGLSYVESIKNDEKHIYKVALSNPLNKNLTFQKLKKETLKEGKYLKFTLKGSYQGVWPAFDYIYKYINESEYELADGPCIENYLNDPNVTPENELITDLLIPIK